jgi:hypothetical protein
MQSSDLQLGVIFGSFFGALVCIALLCTIVYFLCFHHLLQKNAANRAENDIASLESLCFQRLDRASIGTMRLINYSSEPTSFRPATSNNAEWEKMAVANGNLLNPLSLRISPSVENIRQSTDESGLPVIVSVRITPPSTSRGQLTPVGAETDTVTLRTGAAPLVLLSDRLGNYSNSAYYASEV